MKYHYPTILLTITLSVALLAGCAQQKPEGPAEKIGKGLDQILQGSQELSDTYGATPTEQSEQRRKAVAPKDTRNDLRSDDWWREREQGR